jgi:DNA-binding transcriptional regulator YiaG
MERSEIIRQKEGQMAMTPDRVREICDQLNISQMGLSRLLHCDGRTVRRWVAGDLAIPYVVAGLLELMAADKIKLTEFYKFAAGKKVSGEIFEYRTGRPRKQRRVR